MTARRLLVAMMMIGIGFRADARDHQTPQHRSIASAFHSRYDSLRVHSAPTRPSTPNSPSYGIELVDVTEAGVSIAAAISGDLMLVNYATALVIYDISSPGVPVRLAYLPIAENFNEIAIDGTYAYLGGSEGLLTVVNFTDPSAPTIVSATPFGPGINAMDIHGNLLFLAEGWDPSFIVDITNPASPVAVGTFDAAGTGAVDVAYESNHLFVAIYGFGIRIYNITNAAAPVLVGSFPIPGPDAKGIVVSGGIAYTIGTFSGVMRVIDVSQPSSPMQIGSLTMGANLWDIELGAQGVCVARQGDYDSSIEIVDVSNPTNPVVASSTDIEPIVAPYSIAATSDRVAVISFDRFTSVYDVSDPGAPILHGTIESLGSSNGMADAGDWLALPLNQNGLLLVERDDFNVRHRLDGIHWELDSSFAASDGSFVFISGFDSVWDPDQSGVSIIDITDPGNPWERSFLPTSYYGDISLNGSLAYLLENGLAVIDWSNASSPQVIGSLAVSGRYVDIDVPYLIVGGGGTTFDIVDIAMSASPSLASRTAFGWHVSDVEISSSYAIIAGRRLEEPTITNGVWIYDLVNPANPVEVGMFTISAIPKTLIVEWPHIYLNAYDGLHMIDVSNPTSPFEVGFIACGVLADDVVVDPPYIYALSSGLMKLRADALVTDVPNAPATGLRLLTCYPNPFNPETVIRWSVDSASRVSLHVYDVQGRLVRVLEDRAVSPGDYFATWDGRGHDGQQLASGVYFCRLSNGGQVTSMKAVLLK